MIKCEICGKEFKNNLGGDLTNHIRDVHNMSTADYYVLTVLNEIEPKCQCGYCDERPNFNRGKFSKYAIGHNKYEWQELNYVEKHSHPKCQNPNCDNDVEFYRGKPRKYCSHKCSEIAEPSHWNQSKVKDTVISKYQVENVFQLEEVKEKSKNTLKNNYDVEYCMQSKALVNKRITNNLNKYGVKYPQSLTYVKEKQKDSILKNYGVTHYSKTDEFKELASQNMCKYNENPITNHMIKQYKNTKLYYQSLHEFRFLEYCENISIIDDINNSPTFKYLDSQYGKWHLPDFKYNNNIIEIKSAYWLKRQGGWDKINAKRKSVEACGYVYVLILDENYDEFLKILV